MPSAQSIDTVQKVYIAFYGRPADPGGLQFWGDNLDAVNGNLSAIIDNFANSPEAVALYGGLSVGATIDLIYNQMFGRAPDAAGKQFYVDQLNDPTSGFTLQSITLDVLNGATGADADIISNKLAVAKNFTNSLDTADPTDGANEVAAYGGPAAITEGRALLNLVDETPASLTIALAAIETTIDTLVGRTPAPDAPQIFTLQANNADNFTGGSGDDLFRGPDADSLESTDIIDGGDGYDTLRAEVEDGAAPIVNNVEEIINNASSNSTLDMELITGEEQVWAGNNAFGTHTFDNADMGMVQYIAAENTSLTVNAASSVDLSGANDMLMLGIDDSTSTFHSANANDIEEILLEVISGTSNFANLGTFSMLETIRVGGEGNITVQEFSPELSLVDATALDGALYLDSGTPMDATVHGGSGNDVVYTGTGNDTIFGYEGSDQLAGFEGDDVIYGGNGDDLLNGAAVIPLDGSLGNDTLYGEAGNDFLFGGDGNDILNGGTDNDTLTGGSGQDEFRFDGGDGTNTITDFGLFFGPDKDTIAFENGGAITFANSTDTGTGSDLHADDFAVITALFDTTGTPADYDQKVVYLNTNQSTDDIANNLGGSAEFYLAVGNTDTGHMQIWYDDDWSTASGRELLVNLTSMNNTGFFLNSDFGIFE